MESVTGSNVHNPPQQIFRLPQVQLIGAQKAGTSSVANWLFVNGGFSRPKVFENEPWYYSKEVHFFDIGWRYCQGVEFYAKRFQESSGLCLDATPDTLPFPERVQLTYEAAGGNQVRTVKFIVIIREPVSRELSLYNHLAFDNRNLVDSERNEWHDQIINDDGSIMSFEEFVLQRTIPALEQENGPGQSSRHGMYAKHLSKWFRIFDRKQILVLSYHELNHHPERVQERIQQFLGRRIQGNLRKANVLDNPLKVSYPCPRMKEILGAIFKPLNENLYRLLESSTGPVMEEKQMRFPQP